MQADPADLHRCYFLYVTDQEIGNSIQITDPVGAPPLFQQRLPAFRAASAGYALIRIQRHFQTGVVLRKGVDRLDHVQAERRGFFLAAVADNIAGIADDRVELKFPDSFLNKGRMPPGRDDQPQAPAAQLFQQSCSPVV